VYHSRYLDFYERARADWLRQAGLSSSEIVKDYGVLLVVRNVMASYRQPARLDDEITVSVDELDLGRAQLTLHQSVSLNGLILATANVNLAVVTHQDFTPTRLPEAMREILGGYL